MSLIGLLIVLLIFCVCVWAARTIMAAFAIPPQIQAVVTVIIVLIAVLWLVQNLGLLSSGPVLHLR